MSGRTYQTLQRYKGSLYGASQYSGLEYDYEVPDNIVVSSPGGVSTTQHHYTKGFYGNGATTYDVYAGEGNAYPYGELGNLYQVGQNAPHELGMYPPGTDQMYTGNQSTAHVENFQYEPLEKQRQIGETMIPGMELIAPSDAGSSVQVASAVAASAAAAATAAKSAIKAEVRDISHQIHLPSPWVVLLMITLIYISVDFVSSASQSILISRFHGGKAPGWKWLMFYAAICIAIAIAVGTTFQDPLLALKKFEGGTD